MERAGERPGRERATQVGWDARLAGRGAHYVVQPLRRQNVARVDEAVQDARGVEDLWQKEWPVAGWQATDKTRKTARLAHALCRQFRVQGAPRRSAAGTDGGGIPCALSGSDPQAVSLQTASRVDSQPEARAVSSAWSLALAVAAAPVGA